MLGHGEPIRVKRGERVLFHVLNGSATEIRSLALPGHTFQGRGARRQSGADVRRDVPVLWLGTAERVSAIVEMNHPGVWVLGDLADDDRATRHGHRRRIRRRQGQAAVGQAASRSAGTTRRFAKSRRGRRRRRIETIEHDSSPSTTPRDTGSTAGPSTAWRSRWSTWQPTWQLQHGQALPAAHAQRQRRHPPDAPAPPQLRTDQRSPDSRPPA